MDTKYILRVIDFETTGVPTDEEQHCVIEAAYVDILAGENCESDCFDTIVHPENGIEIGVESQAVHHISQHKAVREGRKWQEVEDHMKSCNEGDKLYFVAHNADFEKKFFNPENSTWIDTYKVALVLYPDAPKHTNQVLKYYLGLQDRPHHHPPHRALPDCFVTSEILIKMSEKMTFKEMIRVSREPPYLTKMPFGKHKGQDFDSLPYDYCQWLIKQSDMSEGVKAAAQRRLNRGI